MHAKLIDDLQAPFHPLALQRVVYCGFDTSERETWQAISNMCQRLMDSESGKPGDC